MSELQIVDVSKDQDQHHKDPKNWQYSIIHYQLFNYWFLKKSHQKVLSVEWPLKTTELILIFNYKERFFNVSEVENFYGILTKSCESSGVKWIEFNS